MDSFVLAVPPPVEELIAFVERQYEDKLKVLHFFEARNELENAAHAAKDLDDCMSRLIRLYNVYGWP
tara:strand:+ start:359 stop:559 length:201 start_codon:yes stop_codon:yes gene_type:complete